jgi:hypothetical protein
MEAMKLGAAVLAFAVPLAAEFAPEKWKYRKTILAPPGAGLAAAALDRETFLGAQTGLADLRVVRGAEEIPYLLETRTGASEAKSVAAVMLDKAAGAGAVSLVLEFPRLARHSRIDLATKLRNFRVAATVEAGENRRDWELVKKATLFDFTEEDRSFSSLSITYPTSTRRYLRLRIEGFTDPEAVTRVTATEVVEEPPEFVSFGACAAAAGGSDRPRTALHLCDLGEEGVPASQAVFEIGAADRARGFHRAAEIEASADGKTWRAAGSGVLAKTADGEALTLPLPGNTGRTPRYWRARLYHGDDRPIAVERIRFESFVRVLRFERSQPGEYRLYFGNPDANAPSYDLARRLGTGKPEAALATLGPREANPDYREPAPPSRPFSERHPGLLTAVLAAAVLGLGTVAVRFLRSANR